MAKLTREQVWYYAGLDPHPGQLKILGSRARHRCACCGRRFGKSVVGGATLLDEVTYTRFLQNELTDLGRRREFWIVGPEYSDSEKEFRVLWDTVKRLEIPMDKPGSYYTPEGGPMVVSLFGGRFICHAKSAKYPSTLVGEGLCGVVMAEAAKLKELVWTKYLRPALADAHLSYGRGWSLWLTTPEGKNWFYQVWMRALRGVRDWESFRMPSWENNLVFPLGAPKQGLQLLKDALERREPLTDELIEQSGVDPEIAAMLDEMSEEKFNQEVGADFSEFVGRVFKQFDEEVHVQRFEYNPNLPLYGAVDYGWTNPFVWLDLQVDAFNNVYVLNEYYQTERDTNECAVWLRDNDPYATRAKLLFPDPAEPDDTHTLSKILHVRAAGNTGGELRTRLELIRNALKPAPAGWPTVAGGIIYINGPRLLIHPRCTELIREMNDYKYPETRADAVKNPKDEPLDKDNHGPEALGRFYKGYFGKVARRPSRQRDAKVVA